MLKQLTILLLEELTAQSINLRRKIMNEIYLTPETSRNLKRIFTTPNYSFLKTLTLVIWGALLFTLLVIPDKETLIPGTGYIPLVIALATIFFIFIAGFTTYFTFDNKENAAAKTPNDSYEKALQEIASELPAVGYTVKNVIPRAGASFRIIDDKTKEEYAAVLGFQRNQAILVLDTLELV